MKKLSLFAALFCFSLVASISFAHSEGISSEDLKSFTDQYNSFYEKSPSIFKSLIGTETIRVSLTLSDGDTVTFGIKTVDGKITESSPTPYAGSTLAISFSQEILERIGNSDNPVAEFQKAWGTEIKIQGLSLGNIIKFFFVNLFLSILKLFSPQPAATYVEGSILNYVLTNSSSSKDYPSILLGQYAASEDH